MGLGKEGKGALTLEEGADLPPGCHTPLAGVLAQCHLQEEHRDATGEEEDEVGDEEGSWEEGEAGPELWPRPPETWALAAPPSAAGLTPPRAQVSFLLSTGRDRYTVSSESLSGWERP